MYIKNSKYDKLIQLVDIESTTREAVRYYLSIAMLIFVSMSFSACTSSSKKADTLQEEQKYLGNYLTYSERDSSKNAYKVGIFVNNEYMHIEDDRTPNDFILFDRKMRKIYNVNSSDNSIMVINFHEVNIQPPLEIKYESKSQPSAAIPEVQGNTATHYRFDANGAHCYDAVTLEIEFMPDVVAAMKEYRMVLAGEHAKSVGSIPPEMVDACDLALNVFYTTNHLKFGLPIREWDRKGYQRFLANYRFNYKFSPEKLRLPQGYSEFSIGE